MKKEKIYEIIFGYRTEAGKKFDIYLLIAIFLSVIGVILSTDIEINKKYGLLLNITEWIFTILFTIEYFLRIYCVKNKRRYILSFMGIVDLLAIIPTYLMFFYPPIIAVSGIRVIRMIRIFRIFKLSQYTRGAYTMQIALRSSRPKIIVFLVSISIIVIILGALMYIIEGQENGFNNIASSIYWAIITLTTVGYGNIVPATVLGKFLAAFIMILGYAIIAVPTGIVTAELSRAKHQKQQTQNQNEIIEKEDEIIEKEDEIIEKEDKIIEKLEILKRKIEKLEKKIEND